MRSYKEIRKNSAPGASSAVVLLKDLSCQKQSSARCLRKSKFRLRDHFIQFCDTRVSHREFGVNDSIDSERTTHRCCIKLSKRPVPPPWVVGDNIEKDVRIDQDHYRSPRVSAMI